jgi:predicted short-subunit dehydrogenase-like oxidoreductase (DUF2520 family)
LLDAVAAARPEARVRLVLGSDIVASGETGKWHRWDQIAATYDPVVVPRTGHGDGLGALPEVSSTRVREDIAAGHWPEVAAQVPAAVVDLLRQPCRGTIAVIGEGHVATHAVPWLRRRGYLVVQAPGRDPRAALQSDTRVTGVWLLVEDRAIASVAQVCVGSIPPGTPVLHAAGPFLAADVLRPLQAAGHPVGTLHPICSLRRERPWPPRLNDAGFGIEGDPQARALAIDLVGVQPWLDLQAFDEAGRRAYHGACALLANHLAVLLDAAGSVLRGQGHDDANIDAALAVLLRSAVDNLLALGIPAGITGPVARGDTATVRAHLEALPAEVAELYAVLSARLTAMI